MPKEILIENELIVSIEDLNDVLTRLDSGYSGIVVIKLSNVLQKFDIAFIGGLLLYRVNYPDVFFQLSYERFTSISDADNALFEVRQYLMHCKELYHFEERFLKVNSISTLKEADLVASDSFAPILLINKNNIKSIFSVPDETDDLYFKTKIFEIKQKYIDGKLKGRNNEEKTYFDSETCIVKRLQKSAPIYTFVFTL